jgi:hypothetical protein
MSTTTIPTMDEHAAEIERVAVARCICKRGRFPSAGDVAREIQTMHSELVRGAPVEAVVTRADAVAWLKSRGLPVPAALPREVAGTI